MLSVFLAAAPWQIRSDSPLLMGLLGGTVGLLLLLLFVGKVPISYNVYNLTTRWVTTIMTALAFTLVIGLLTVMLAFVNGMYNLTEQSGQPGNVIILAEGSTDETFSNLGVTDISDIENQPGVARNDKGEPLVSRETYIIVNQPIDKPQPGKPKRRFLSVRGIDDPAMSGFVHGMALSPGSRWFSDAGVQQSAGDPSEQAAIEVVLGSGIATQLGSDRTPAQRAKARNPNRLDIDDTFELNYRTWKVVGIMESEGSTFDSEVWAKRSLVGPMFGKNSYSTLVLRTEPAFRKDQRKAVMAARNKRADDNFERAQAAYEKKVAADKVAREADPKRKSILPNAPEREKVETPKSEAAWGAEMLKEYFNTEYEKSKVNSIVETKYFENLSSTNLQFLYAIEFVAVVLAIGGVFGVMNTMFAAVSQRVKDVGVLRLLGFKRWQVLVSFLLESMVIAIVGSLVGCAFGYLWDGVTASSIVSSGQGGGGKAVVLKLVVDLSTLAMGIFLGVAMGFLGGLIPSLSAMRLTALEALR
jgi:putative ABC transport system permease protein